MCECDCVCVIVCVCKRDDESPKGGGSRADNYIMNHGAIGVFMGMSVETLGLCYTFYSSVAEAKHQRKKKNVVV